MSERAPEPRPRARHGRVRIGVVSVLCFLRGVPLFATVQLPAVVPLKNSVPSALAQK